MKDELESIIDKVGLSKVLFMLAEICGEKSDHLRANWQADAFAKQWDADQRALEKLAAKIRST